MAITVELYKEVRRMHLDGVSQRQIATRLGISQNTVRKYLDGNVVPWERKACYAGFYVLFKNAATLSTELCEARDSYSLGKLERTLNCADLLTLHELSYLSFNRHQSALLFKKNFRLDIISSERYNVTV